MIYKYQHLLTIPQDFQLFNCWKKKKKRNKQTNKQTKPKQKQKPKQKTKQNKIKKK